MRSAVEEKKDDERPTEQQSQAETSRKTLDFIVPAFQSMDSVRARHGRPKAIDSTAREMRKTARCHD
jgi:hypothetical protein